MILIKRIIYCTFLFFLFLFSIYLFNTGYIHIIKQKYYDAIVYFNIGIIFFAVSCMLLCFKENIESENN